MQLGFVIDHSRCIGCHACTVACKSENDVPVGSFRTWVKYTEQGSFPSVRRNFAVLRCNQCTAAPCVTICPTKALHKRDDGIVDVASDACIGCKSCMQACPYDALYINEDQGIAEKCHFCAHRTEQGLAPACAVVCPTEAIIPGDFHDPESAVSRLRAAGGLEARKTEAGTGPNVFYREAAPAGLDPLQTTIGTGFLWANQKPGPQLDADTFRALEGRAEARTTYDAQHAPLWGWKVWSYLVTKGIAAGAFLLLALLVATQHEVSRGMGLGLVGAGLLFLGVTTVLLVADLKRPERFLYILRRPNWSSWLVKGSVILMGFGITLSICMVMLLMAPASMDAGTAIPWFATAATAVLAALTAMYTAWLFAQAKGRVLWMKRGLALHLLVQALLAGAALGLILSALGFDVSERTLGLMRVVLVASAAANFVLLALERHCAPKDREKEYAEVMHLVERGPFARSHLLAQALSGWVPGLAVLVPQAAVPLALGALVGLVLVERVFVRAGQALPIH